MNSINRLGATALVVFALAGCDSSPTTPTDSGMTGGDSGMTGTDAGMMTGTDSGMMTGTDAGMMMATDAGPPDMMAVARERAGIDRIVAASCGCDMGTFASTMECEAFGDIAEADTCFDSAFTAHFDTVGSFFTCVAPAREAQATCVEAASCDTAARTACNDTYDAAFMTCQALLNMDDVTAYTATLDACLDTMVVGPMGMCPDDMGAIMTVGASVFSGTTVGAGDDLAPPTGCVTAMGGGSSPDMAFRWTAPAAGTFIFDTAGTGFDTVLYVLSGCDAAMSHGCNDDISDMDLRSSVTATVTMGQEVLVVVEGFSSNSAGSFVVNINEMAAP